MFWSLVLEPGKQYSSTVGESFHLSMATLDIKSAKNVDDVFPVQLQIEEDNLILCNLSKPHCLQVNLDLIFQKGTKVTFYTSGQATIHLTGYIIQDDLTEPEDSSEEESDVDNFEFKNLPTKKKTAEKLNFKEKDKPQQLKSILKQDTPKRKLEPADTTTKKKPKTAGTESSDEDESESDDLAGMDNLSTSMSDMEDEEDEDLDEEEEDEDEENETLGTTASFDDLNDEDEDDDEDDESEEEKSKQTAKQTPKKKPNEVKTQTQDKSFQNKTPLSNKKEGKQGKQNQNVPNGTTPKSEKKEKNKNTPQQQQQQQKHEKNTSKSNEFQSSPQKRTVEGGVIVEDLKVGNGPVAKPGRMLAVYYTGRLKSNNRVFDQSNSGPGFKFRLGRQEVIKGWDVGLTGMKVGSKRRITCPAAMAYGAKGSPPSIPPNSTLVFEVELKSVN